MHLLVLFLIVFPLSLIAQTNPSLYVGIASTDATPPVGVPLGGYGGTGRRLKFFLDWGGKYPLASYLKPSHGVLDPLRAKTMIVKNNQRSFLFVSLDVIGISAEFHQDLKSRVKNFNFSEIFISATHTHSGPGALSKSKAWQIIAMDKFSREVYERLMTDVIESIELSYQRLEPAKLYATYFEAGDLHRNRRNKPGHTDPEARLLLAKNLEGEVLGGMINYAIHGCALGEENLLISADVSGGIERHLEKLLAPQSKGIPTILFMNGAEGDVTNVYNGAEGIERTGSLFAEKAEKALENLSPIGDDLSYSMNRITLAKGRFNFKKCGVGKKDIKIYLGQKALPRTADVWQIKMGDIRIYTFPGEPTTSIGFAAKEFSKKYSVGRPWIFGLTNNHMGYFLTPEEYAEGRYESCVTFHGPNAGVDLLNAHEAILKSKK